MQVHRLTAGTLISLVVNPCLYSLTCLQVKGTLSITPPLSQYLKDLPPTSSCQEDTLLTWGDC